jgi:hypothetical protein
LVNIFIDLVLSDEALELEFNPWPGAVVDADDSDESRELSGGEVEPFEDDWIDNKGGLSPQDSDLLRRGFDALDKFSICS